MVIDVWRPLAIHFVLTLERVELLELSPVAEHDRTMATLARNLGLVAS
jgi:hypothetical protein